jgi:predicted amidohydrolase
VTSLHVSLIQPDLVWLDPPANLDHLSQLLSEHLFNTDLIVLPEMFTSGFTQYPEPLLGHQDTITWMQQQAKYYNAAVTGSIACEVDASATEASRRYVNRMLFVTPNGEITFYDKRHLFTMAGEHERYHAGNERCVVNYRGWRLLLTICYDLRFPVFCRNRHDYDAMLCVANWPQVRRHPWRTLLQARAIENQAYVIGVNRVGTDGNGLRYNGDSMAVDFLGQPMVDGGQGGEQVLGATFNKEQLLAERASFPVLADADTFKLL